MKNNNDSQKTRLDFYVVSEKDTLWNLAKEKLGSSKRYAELAKLNHLKHATLCAGQVLLIPEK